MAAAWQRRILFGVAMVILNLVAACQQHRYQSDVSKLSVPDDKRTVIKWQEPFDLGKATFYIDGARVGTGLSAFDKVIRHLSGLRRGDELTIQFPKKWSTMRLDGDGRTGDMWEFPFEGHLDKEKEFTKLCGAKSLVISFEVCE